MPKRTHTEAPKISPSAATDGSGAVLRELYDLHRTAEFLGWDGGTHAYKAAVEKFNVAAWNHVPMLLDELQKARETIANVSARLEPVDITRASKPSMAQAISACRVMCDRHQNTDSTT